MKIAFIILMIIFCILLAACSPNPEHLVTLTATVTPMSTFTLKSTPSATINPRPTNTTTNMATITLASTPTSEFSIGSTRISEEDGMVQVYVPAGEFEMGTSNEQVAELLSQHSDWDQEWFTSLAQREQPVHNVYLDAYWIDQTEVTNAMFQEFVNVRRYQTDSESGLGCVVNTNGILNHEDGANWQYPRTGISNFGKEQYPVVCVSWNDATAYCNWAGKRLPTEAEWEKAARGTDGRIYPWGNDNPSTNLLNFNSNNTMQVGSYPLGASPYNVLDMAGNVGEWVADLYSETYYKESLSNNPTGPSNGWERVIRGGSWYDGDGGVRSANRRWYSDGSTNDNIGFRCVWSAASP